MLQSASLTQYDKCDAIPKCCHFICRIAAIDLKYHEPYKLRQQSCPKTPRMWGHLIGTPARVISLSQFASSTSLHT